MSDNLPAAPAGQSAPLQAALKDLRDDLRRWPKAFAALREAAPLLLEYQRRLQRREFDDQVDPDPRNVQERADWLATYGQPVERRLRDVQEYEVLVERIKIHARTAAEAAEATGINSGPLLLFAADPDEVRWEAARAVVERLSVMAPAPSQPDSVPTRNEAPAGGGDNAPSATSGTAQTVPAPSSGPDPGLLSAPDLARRLEMDVSRVESALRRYREKYPDSCIQIDRDDRRRNEPKYLYRVNEVQPFLENLRDRR